MKAPAFLVAEIVAFVVGDEIHNCAVRQRRRFVENQTSFLDASTQRAHVDTVRRSATISKLSTAVSAMSGWPCRSIAPCAWRAAGSRKLGPPWKGWSSVATG